MDVGPFGKQTQQTLPINFNNIKMQIIAQPELVVFVQCRTIIMLSTQSICNWGCAGMWVSACARDKTFSSLTCRCSWNHLNISQSASLRGKCWFCFFVALAFSIWSALLLWLRLARSIVLLWFAWRMFACAFTSKRGTIIDRCSSDEIWYPSSIFDSFKRRASKLHKWFRNKNGFSNDTIARQSIALLFGKVRHVLRVALSRKEFSFSFKPMAICKTGCE